MKPEIVQKCPFAAEVTEGQTYYWCSCGLSKKQPFCDGGHQGTEFRPTPYKATETKTVHFCGCKHSKNGVLCDGSHSSI
ncbi:MAG: CDGSH iron-sulfur domain-containing protein [Holophagaceae bacterium]